MIWPDTLSLLRQMIATSSFSRCEEAVAPLVFAYLEAHGEKPFFAKNNVCAYRSLDPLKPTLLLNSHLDTVKPAASYSRNPFSPDIEGDVLYGLGSNDAGASVVSLLQTYVSLKSLALPINIVIAITAEEEVGGENGIRLLLPELEKRGCRIDMAIVGEPTGMKAAVAERGLVVLDAVTHGVTGHAARGEGINAIYRAMEDIDRVRNFSFPRESALLGKIGVNVTQIEAGWQHNAIPDSCKWVVDVRTTDAYSNSETAAMLQAVMKYSALTPRSTRVWASALSPDSLLWRAFSALGIPHFVSPTTSDMSLLHGIPSLKIGPGESSRSHRADEHILLSEIESAISIYPQLIKQIIPI
ncbi:MAG: M20/M25/M40 family metallo-hydrolase [Clostridium sp.]|nr:M20/M25/M40 family metallo-hydrolase [Clostridium sp.]